MNGSRIKRSKRATLALANSPSSDHEKVFPTNHQETKGKVKSNMEIMYSVAGAHGSFLEHIVLGTYGGKTDRATLPGVGITSPSRTICSREKDRQRCLKTFV
jgi:hypothetical protein